MTADLENRLQALDPSACRALLAQARFGRLALTRAARPVIVPVLVIADHTTLNLGADPTIGMVPNEDERVAFETDRLDAGDVWSVVVRGRVRLTAKRAPGGFTWSEVYESSITGRRLRCPPCRRGPAGGPAPAIGALSRTEAFRLLAQEDVGRLAVAPGGSPLIFPVNYRLDGECVVFRTGSGTKLHAISRSLVSFEADRYDASGRGWSVTINGWAHEITSSEPKDLRDRIVSLSVEPWAAGDRSYFVRIIPVEVAAYSHCWE